MKYYAIKQPSGPLWWIADSEHNAWMAFFTYPNQEGNRTAYRLCLADAIRAYRAIGYECVEVAITEVDRTAGGSM
jgi:hypothetical protein